jgi:mono/diheme cytochrome c family protein
LALSLYFLLLGMCFTGYLLPMDQNAYWGTVVRLGIMETIPGIGSDLAQMMRGGQVFNASTLPRFYALHVAVLPIFCGLLLAPLLSKASARLSRTGHWVAWTMAGLGAVALLYLLAASNMAPLELRADPTDPDYVPRPEWYFLWLFQFGKYVESVPWVESLVVPMAGLAFLFALPLMTRQGFGTRLAVALAWVTSWVALTGLAIHQDRDLEPKLPYELAMEVRANDAYKDLCLECHGAEGRGDGARSLSFDLEARDFTQPEVWQEISETEMIRSTRDGKGKDMPSFGRQLNHEEIVAVLTFMKTNFAPADTSRSEN